VGAYAILGTEMCINQTNYGLKARPEVGDWFLFLSIGDLVEHLRQLSYGTIFDTITTETLRGTEVVLPAADVLRVFEQLAAPLFKKALANLRENRSLSLLRDTILPKLISGEIRVPVNGVSTEGPA
jgi:type I restriction enzyme S subunit